MHDPILAHVATEYHRDVMALPAALRLLLEQELAAGNRVIEVGHTHPAAPVGAYFLLANRVSTQPRATTPSLHFYERHTTQYFGEFTDEQRHFFVLEAPEPQPPPPDMDAIREAANASRPRAIVDPGNSPALRRFQESLQIDYEKWREGIGYDLEAFAELTAEEQERAIARMIPPQGWREVEVLLASRSPGAKEALQRASRTGPLEVQLAIARLAPKLVNDEVRTQTLIRALASADIMGGLSQALDQIEEFHPPAIEAELWRGLREREGDVAYHCAATLALIHGKINSRFDWTYRPLFLRFNTTDASERRAAEQELRTLLGVPQRH